MYRVSAEILHTGILHCISDPTRLDQRHICIRSFDDCRAGEYRSVSHADPDAAQQKLQYLFIHIPALSAKNAADHGECFACRCAEQYE